MDDINDLLTDTSLQLRVVSEVYAKCQEEGEENRRLRPRVKNVLENQRSILDYLALLVHEKYGKQTRAKIYYPFSNDSKYFNRDIDKRMPGVRANQPDVAEIIKKHQPFNQEWMPWLDGLRNEAGHRKLNKQTATNQTKTTLHHPGGGKSYVQGISFQDAKGNELTAEEFFGIPTTDSEVVEWVFAEPEIPVPVVLGLIQTGVSRVVQNVARVAGL